MAKDYIHPELTNLADKIDEDEILSLGEETAEFFRYDRDDLSAWEAKHADWLEMYYQNDHAKDPPWEGSSQESIPILAEAAHQFHSRAYLGMFGQPQLVQAVPTGKASDEDKERAERVSLHMTWQLTIRDKKYKENKDSLLLSVPIHGSFFTKTYYDPQLRRNVTRNVRATDLVVPYGTGPRDIEDLERKTEIIWMPAFKTEHLARSGFFTAPAESYTRHETSPADDAHDKAHGVQQSRPDRGPAQLLESHCMLDLDGDGLMEPYILTVDGQTNRALRLSIRWLTDAAGNAVDEAGKPLNPAAVSGPAYSGLQHLPKVPIEYYTHYSFLKNPDGFYGLGLGHLLGPPNRAVNKLLRQIVDAGTLANAGNMSGFVSDALALAGGEVEISLGKFKKVPMSGDDIRSAIVQMNFPGPSQAMFAVLELIMQRSDRLGTATEAVTGQLDRALQPTTLLALLEESGRIFSAVNERTVGSWRSELDKHYRLNATFLDPVEYYSVLDADGGILGREVHRADYAPDLAVQPAVDPRMTTRRQKLAQAEAEWNFLSQNPLVARSPMHFYNASKRFLRAIGAERIEEVLPSPDPTEWLVAALRTMGFKDREIEEIVGQIGAAAVANQSGDQGSDPGFGGPFQGVPLEDGQIAGGAQTLTGSERGNGVS